MKVKFRNDFFANSGMLYKKGETYEDVPDGITLPKTAKVLEGNAKVKAKPAQADMSLKKE